MAKISTYPIAANPSLSDMLIGTNVDNDNATKNFSLGDVYSLFNDLNPPACCSYYNMNTMQANVIDFPYGVFFPNESISQGVSVNGDINFQYSGVYIINVKARVVHTSGGGDAKVSFCLRDPAGAIDYSLQTFTIPNQHTQSIDYSFMFNLNIGAMGSQFGISWFTNNINAKLISSPEVNQYEPASPSATLNIYKVSPVVITP